MTGLWNKFQLKCDGERGYILEPLFAVNMSAVGMIYAKCS